MTANTMSKLETERRCFKISPQLSHVAIAEILELGYWHTSQQHRDPTCYFFAHRGGDGTMSKDYTLLAIRTKLDELTVFSNRFEEAEWKAFSIRLGALVIP